MTRAPESLVKKVLGIGLFIVLLPVILPLAALVLFLSLFNKGILYLIVWILWIPRRKDVLYVSSDSSTWQNYMEAEIFPLVAARAVTLNWSSRKKWSKYSIAVHIFRTWGGSHEFNPMTILFRPFRAAQVFRFFRPFQESKHGDPTSLDQLRRDLIQALHNR